MQSCLCYKGPKTEHGQPRKEIKIKNTFNKNIFEVIDTLAIYENITYIQNENVYPVENSRGKFNLRFYNNGKFGAFSIGFDNKNFKLIPNYKVSRKDFDPLKSQMGYYYSQNDKIYLKRLIINQCQIDVYESEIIVDGDTITQINLREKGSKTVYVKRKVPKEFLENWKPDW
ncbi:MAG: hypothetical protein ACWIPJ_07620 [Polaribacter sp.]